MGTPVSQHLTSGSHTKRRDKKKKKMGAGCVGAAEKKIKLPSLLRNTGAAIFCQRRVFLSNGDQVRLTSEASGSLLSDSPRRRFARSLELRHCVDTWSLRGESERRHGACMQFVASPAELPCSVWRAPRSGGPQLHGTELSIKRTQTNKQTKTHTLLLQTSWVRSEDLKDPVSSGNSAVSSPLTSASSALTSARVEGGFPVVVTLYYLLNQQLTASGWSEVDRSLFTRTVLVSEMS